MPRIQLFFSICLFLVLVVSATAHARLLNTKSVPEELQSWIPWVLHDSQRQTDCPFIYNQSKNTQCAWPSTLSLDLKQSGGTLKQQWRVYKAGWLPLPGSAKHWPQEVTVNGKKTAVTVKNGKPSIYARPGSKLIKARLIWDHLPESLDIPVSTGIVSLHIADKQVTFPDLENGKLWIRQRSHSAEKKEEDRITFRVFRHINDTIPMKVTTFLQMEVSGKQREINIGNPLLGGFIPLQLNSKLPARLESDGLRLQVRPGRWNVSLLSRHPASLESLQLVPNVKTWPTREVWVFKSQNTLRLVEVEGVATIDPRQTQLPKKWRGLPAYQLKTNDKMLFKLIRRGDPDPAPDQLTLNRQLWLQFDGKNYTVQDTIGGSKTAGWRLSAQPALHLGRVLVDGRPQFITTLNSQQQGIEVRRGNLNVQAEGQIKREKTLPAVGWDHDFKQVNASLQLPPGWKLFSVSGVDNVPDSWVQRWTLLDLFLVLIITISVSRLWSWYWGLFALITVALLWHEPMAPKFIWLNILAAIGLLRVLPEGKLKQVVGWYQMLALVSLVVLAIPFMVNEIRHGLYPQLERGWAPIMPIRQDLGKQAIPASQSSRDAGIAMEAEQPVMSYSDSVSRKIKNIPNKLGIRATTIVSGDFSKQRQNMLLGEIDPNANVQTGPGLPKWRWQNIPLRWNGPVDKSQQVGLILISPAQNFILNLLRVVLLCVLGALMFGIRFKPESGFSLPPLKLSFLAGLIAIPIFMTAPADTVMADIPTPEMLKELKTRLLKKPECLPRCAQIPRMRINLDSHSLELLLEVHALEDVAVPLPGHKAHWMAQEVLVDGKQANGLYRSKEGQLWLDVTKGIHQVNMRGALPKRKSVQLPLPLKPRFVETTIKGWRIEGLHENGLADAQLQLTRIQSEAKTQSASALEPGTLPPFVRVERTLRLGLEWLVDTTVIRESPTGSAVLIEVPLLNSESVTTEGLRIKDGKALINMGANQRIVSWHSRLDIQTVLSLVAPKTTAWSETWRVDISPIWHARSKGISVVHHTDPGGRWLPTWQPWPGEQIQLNITRPKGVEGQTKTIDQSILTIKPGQRSTESTLSFSLRSSQGGQHTLSLPANAELQSVKINNAAQPIRQKGRSVTLPIHPGHQSIELVWRTAQALPISFSTESVDLGVKSVNHSINVKLGQDRWLMFVKGPQMGPAVLFWGVLIVIIFIAVGLGRIKMIPLKTWQWVLLGIGLSQSSIETVVVVVGWLFALALRERMKEDISDSKFNFTQVTLVILTLLALVQLFGAISHGLLGYPDMQIQGNQSNAYDLKWYQDQTEAVTPTAWMLSVPLMTYRLLMLAWSIWLAFALLQWLKWGWQSFSTHGLWRTIELKRAKKGKDTSEGKETSEKNKSDLWVGK